MEPEMVWLLTNKLESVLKELDLFFDSIPFYGKDCSLQQKFSPRTACTDAEIWTRTLNSRANRLNVVLFLRCRS